MAATGSVWALGVWADPVWAAGVWANALPDSPTQSQPQRNSILTIGGVA